MKFQKTLALVLALVLVTALFAGCGEKESDLEVLNILYPGDETDRMTSYLENEFAERMATDLGMKVNVTFVSWDAYWEQKDIMLAAKEPVDLYWDGLPDLSTMVNKKQAMPLDDLINDYGQDMLKVMPMDQIQGGKIDGVIYGIPTAYAPSSAMFQLVTVRQDLLEAVGMSEITSPDDLMTFSKLVTEQFPEIKGGGDPLFKPLTRYYTEEQYNWVASEDSVVFGEDSHKIYSYFETEAFQELAKFNREMTEAGLFTDEVTIKYNERDSRVQSGLYTWVEGSLGKENEIIGAVQGNAPEAVLKSYLLAPEKPKYITAAGGEVVCIPLTATNPEGAMKFLNWMYTSEDNYNFALYGVEGTDFNIVNERIESVNGDEFFYEWMFRNKNFQRFGSETDQAFIDLYNTWDDDAIVSKSFGFAFDNSAVKDIEAAINQVAGTDFLAIETGFVDFDEAYPLAVEKLKAAGIDAYVAEVQRQMDEFLAK